MLIDSGWYLLAGGLAGAGAVLVAQRLARVRWRKLPAAGAGKQLGPSAYSDRHELLALLRQLARWTGEYSRTVAQHQNQLSDLLKQVQQQPGGATGPYLARVAGLLSEILQSNHRLQQRLGAAETQLDCQTGQLQSYFTEARTDGLTQLGNRRAFDVKVEQMLVAYRESGQSFVLAMLDIDHFKGINDRYGHQAGDAVLQFLGSALRQAFAGAPLLARYGGEEFALILSGPLRLAAERVDGLRQQLAKERIVSGGQLLQVTLSCGLSEPAEEAGAAQLIRQADEALYAAKHSGRNCVYYHDGRRSVRLGASERADPTTT